MLYRPRDERLLENLHRRVIPSATASPLRHSSLNYQSGNIYIFLIIMESKTRIKDNGNGKYCNIFVNSRNSQLFSMKKDENVWEEKLHSIWHCVCSFRYYYYYPYSSFYSAGRFSEQFSSCLYPNLFIFYMPIVHIHMYVCKVEWRYLFIL